MITSTYLPISGGTLTGDLLFSDSGTALRGIYGTVGLYDSWRLIGGASAENSGWLELATADDGTEPIYVRQYKYDENNPGDNFNNPIRTATLLDESGNTSFPGTVTASAFSGNASSATKATQDGSGNEIVSTYSTKTELSNCLPLAGGSITGLLSITNTGIRNYSEGIRIHNTTPGAWDTIMLCGSDNAGDLGTSANSWAVLNNDGNFYITRNGSGNGGSSTLSNVNSLWGVNTNTPTHTLTVNGSGSFTDPIDSTYRSPNFIGGVSNAVINCKGSGYVGWINGPTREGRASISTYPDLDNVIYFNYGTSADIAANTNVVTSIRFDLAASSILASRATFNSSTDVTLSSYGSEPLTIVSGANNLGIDGDEIQARANGAATDLFLNRKGGPVHFGVNQYYITSDGSNYTGNATTSYSSNYIKSNTWNWSGVGPQGTEGTVRKIASITDMRYLEIDGGNMVGNMETKGIVKISMTYIDGLIISNNSTVSTNFGYVITSTYSGRGGKVNIDLYLQERSGENYYNILVSKLVGSSISFESPSAAAIPAPVGYVAIS